MSTLQPAPCRHTATLSPSPLLAKLGCPGVEDKGTFCPTLRRQENAAYKELGAGTATEGDQNWIECSRQSSMTYYKILQFQRLTNCKELAWGMDSSRVREPCRLAVLGDAHRRACCSNKPRSIPGRRACVCACVSLRDVSILSNPTQPPAGFSPQQPCCSGKAQAKGCAANHGPQLADPSFPVALLQPSGPKSTVR
jgi:hypothetical protein